MDVWTPSSTPPKGYLQSRIWSHRDQGSSARAFVIEVAARNKIGDPSTRNEFDAQALDRNSGVQWRGVLAGVARQPVGADLRGLRNTDLRQRIERSNPPDLLR